jgi:anti-sigma regulatory factor (Ser/Thr protein kinase)
MSEETAYCHTAGVVRSDAELFGAAATYVRDGVAAGDLVVISGAPSFTTVLTDRFGSADRVVVDDRIRLNGHRAPDAIGACVEVSRHAAAEGRRVRLLAQVDQPDDPRAVHEFACFESAANLMSTAVPASVLCLYDTRRLAPSVLEIAQRTHPFLLAPDGRRPSDAYADPRAFFRAVPLPREPLQDGVPVLAVDDAPTLAGLRRTLGAELARAVPDREQREDLHLGLSEMAANAFRHGAPPVSARLWAAHDRLVCTISDRGPGVDPVAGYWPAHGDDLGRGGMGLWLARKLFDHVDLFRDGDVTTVRLATALR